MRAAPSPAPKTRAPALPAQRCTLPPRLPRNTLPPAARSSPRCATFSRHSPLPAAFPLIARTPEPPLNRPPPNSCRLSLCQHTQKECPKALHCVMYFAAHRAVSRDLNGRIALSLLSEVTQPQRRRRLALALAHDAGDDQHDDGDEIRDHLDDLALRKGHADIVGHKVQHAEQYGA